MASKCEMRDVTFPVRNCQAFDWSKEFINWNETATVKCDKIVFDHSVYESTVVTKFQLYMYVA